MNTSEARRIDEAQRPDPEESSTEARLRALLERVREDAHASAARYLNETIVPEGGE